MKPLCGEFLRGTVDAEEHHIWRWLNRGQLKNETEVLITAAQDQALRTKTLKSIIDMQDIPKTCRLCVERERRMLSHIVASV